MKANTQYENFRHMDKAYPEVYIVLLNYDNWPDTIECLESVFRNSYPNYKVLLVDNCSTDQSLHYLRLWAEGRFCYWLPPDNPLRKLSVPPISKPISIEFFQAEKTHFETEKEDRSDEPNIKNCQSNSFLLVHQAAQNLGFAGGNNIAIRYALSHGADYVLLLNNDTVVTQNFLIPLVKTAQSNKRIGMVGGKIFFYSDPHKLWAAGGGKINSFTSGMKHIGVFQPDNRKYSKSGEVDYITGCLLLVKKKVIEKIGLMNEDYFLYYEETDWNLRAQKAGYQSYYVPDSVIYHKAPLPHLSDKKGITYYYTRNRICLVKKNYGGIIKPLTLLYLRLYNLIRIIYNRIKGNGEKAQIIQLAVFHGFMNQMGRFNE